MRAEGLVLSSSPQRVPSTSRAQPSQRRPLSAAAAVHAGRRLFSEGVAQEARKRQWAAEERVKRELRALQLEDCTFTPAITRRAVDMQRPRSLSPQNRIALEQQQRLVKIAEAQRVLREREMEPCTFHPLILDVAKLAAARAERVDPDVFAALHRDAEVRAAWHEKNREGAENAVLVSAGKRAATPPKLSKEQLEQVVLRLMKPEAAAKKQQQQHDDAAADPAATATTAKQSPAAAADYQATHKPSIGRLSEAIARMRFNERAEARNVFDRLYLNNMEWGPAAGAAADNIDNEDGAVDADGNQLPLSEAVRRRAQERIARTARGHFEGFTHQPSISRESEVLATEVRRQTLRQLFGHLNRVLKHDGQHQQHQQQRGGGAGGPCSSNNSSQAGGTASRPSAAAAAAAASLERPPLSARSGGSGGGRSSISPPNSARGTQQQQQQGQQPHAHSISTGQMLQEQEEEEKRREAEIDAACLDIVDIARAASKTLSLDDARSMMEGLIHSGRSAFTAQHFIDSQLAEIRKSGPKHFVRSWWQQQQQQHQNASLNNKERIREQAALREQQEQQGMSTAAPGGGAGGKRARSPPDIDVPRLSREELNEIKERRLQRVVQERIEKLTRECTFRPKLNPVSQQLAAAADAKAKQRRRDGSGNDDGEESVSTISEGDLIDYASGTRQQRPKQQSQDGAAPATVDERVFDHYNYAAASRVQQQHQASSSVRSASAGATAATSPTSARRKMADQQPQQQQQKQAAHLELFETIFARARAGRRPLSAEEFLGAAAQAPPPHQQQEREPRRRPASAGAAAAPAATTTTTTVNSGAAAFFSTMAVAQQQQHQAYARSGRAAPVDKEQAELRALGASLMREQLHVREQRMKQLEEQRAIAAERKRKAQQRQMEQYLRREQEAAAAALSAERNDNDDEPAPVPAAAAAPAARATTSSSSGSRSSGGRSGSNSANANASSAPAAAAAAAARAAAMDDVINRVDAVLSSGEY